MLAISHRISPMGRSLPVSEPLVPRWWWYIFAYQKTRSQAFPHPHTCVCGGFICKNWRVCSFLIFCNTPTHRCAVYSPLSKEGPGLANCWEIAQKQQSSDKFSVIKKCLNDWTPFVPTGYLELDTSQTLKFLIEMENISKWMISIAGLLPKPKCDLGQAKPVFS